MALALYNIFVFIGLGYLAKILRVLGNKQSGILIGFLLNFSLPSQIFIGIYQVDLNWKLLSMMSLGLACALLVAMLVFVFGRYVLRQDFVTCVTFCVLALLGNTLFLGVPIVHGALGEEYANKAILYDQLCTGLPMVIVAPLLMSLGGKEAFSVGLVLRRFMSNPLFYAMFLGFGCKFLPFVLPEWFLMPIVQIGACATPVALFAIGIQMSFTLICDSYKQASMVLFFKMLLVPLLLFCFLKFGGVVFDENWKMILLQSSMPPLLSASVIIIKAGLNAKVALSAATLGILVSGVISPLFLYLASL